MYKVLMHLFIVAFRSFRAGAKGLRIIKNFKTNLKAQITNPHRGTMLISASFAATFLLLSLSLSLLDTAEGKNSGTKG